MLQVTTAVRRGGCHCSSRGCWAELTDSTMGIEGKFTGGGISRIKQTPRKSEVPTPCSGEVPIRE